MQVAVCHERTCELVSSNIKGLQSVVGSILRVPDHSTGLINSQRQQGQSAERKQSLPRTSPQQTSGGQSRGFLGDQISRLDLLIKDRIHPLVAGISIGLLILGVAFFLLNEEEFEKLSGLVFVLTYVSSLAVMAYLL